MLFDIPLIRRDTRVKRAYYKGSFIAMALLSPLSIAQTSPAVSEGDWAHSQSVSVHLRTQSHKLRRLSSHIQRQYRLSSAQAELIVGEAIRQGQRQGIESELILAIISVESGFRAHVIGPGGASGLMQVMPNVHARKVSAIGGRQALLNPAHNIAVGAQILADCLKSSRGNVRGALIRYNGHPRHKYRYADNVLRKYNLFRQVSGSHSPLTQLHAPDATHWVARSLRPFTSIPTRSNPGGRLTHPPIG